MDKTVLPALLLVFGYMSAEAMGQTIFCYSRTADGSRQIRPQDSGMLFPQSGFHAYDNWHDSSDGGISEFRGSLRMGTDEFADDIFPVTMGPAQLSDIGWYVWNFSSTRQLTSFLTTLRFYGNDLTLLGQDSYTYSITVPASFGAGFFSAGGFYRPFGIVLPQQIFMSIQFSEVVGIDPSEIGSVIAGPRTRGYSSQYIRNLTSGQQIDLDGTNQTNLGFFIDTVNVPVPTTAVAFLAVGLMSCRRKRLTVARSLRGSHDRGK